MEFKKVYAPFLSGVLEEPLHLQTVPAAEGRYTVRYLFGLVFAARQQRLTRPSVSGRAASFPSSEGSPVFSRTLSRR